MFQVASVHPATAKPSKPALAAGRLATTERAQRLDSVYTAKTMGDLEPLTRDLPSDGVSEILEHVQQLHQLHQHRAR